MMMEPPMGRLPPLRVLHEQPALDLDTPPPSPANSSESLSVPIIPRSPSPASSTSSNMQYTGEEIEHSLKNLTQCYHILQPGHHACLCTHGRVSSAFSHNKYSVTLADHYSTLRRLMISRSRLCFARECAFRVAQLAAFVQNLQVVAHEEHNTLQALQTGGDIEPYTKLEYLSAFCEDLRIHMNNWTSIQHRLYSDKYLQAVLPKLCQDLSNLQRSLVYWRDCALWWLQQIISIGLRIFAHCSPDTATQDILWSIVRGAENYNGMLVLIRGHCRHAGTTSDSHHDHFQYPRFKLAAVSSRFMNSIQPFSVNRILSILSKERSKLASLQILFFLMRNQSFVSLAKKRPLFFDWATYPCMPSAKASRSGSDQSSYPVNPAAATSSLLTLKDFKAQGLLQESSPQCAIETQEEGFISKLLTAISASTGLLQKHKLLIVSDDEGNQTTSRKLSKLKSPYRNGGKHSDTRKSVRWGDALNAHIQHEFFASYLDMMWACCGDELSDLLHRPGLGLADITLEGIMSLGHVYQCSDSLVVALGHLIEQACGKGVFTAGACLSLQSISRQLIGDLALSQSLSGICEALAASSSDKCFPVSGPASINQGSKTCQLFQVALSPLLSLLSAAEQQHTTTKVLPRGASRNGVSPAIQTPSPKTLLQTLSLSVMVLDASRRWCLEKSTQFLASWSVEKFLLLSQSDLKITIDSSEMILRACQLLCSDDGQQSALGNRGTDVGRLEEFKLKLETINSRLHCTSSEVLQMFGQCCSHMCTDVWQQAMPMGKVWRKKTTDDLPSEHNSYVPVAVNTVLVPLVEGVSKLRMDAQIAIVSVAVANLLETWMAHILREKPKFSVHGAHQLGQDLTYVRTWLISNAQGLELQTRQSVLALDAFKHFDGALTCLRHQPRGKGVNSPTRDDSNSEYSSSTVPSAESRPGSMSSLSDALPQGGSHQALTGEPPLPLGNGSDLGEAAFEEETFRIPRRKEWLSLRVHGNHKWRLLPFGCLNVGVDS